MSSDELRPAAWMPESYREGPDVVKRAWSQINNDLLADHFFVRIVLKERYMSEDIPAVEASVRIPAVPRVPAIPALRALDGTMLRAMQPAVPRVPAILGIQARKAVLGRDTAVWNEEMSAAAAPTGTRLGE